MSASEPLCLSKTLCGGKSFNIFQLQGKNEAVTIKGLTILLKEMANGYQVSGSLLILVIRQLLIMDSKPVQRMLHTFFRLLAKSDAKSGKSKPQLIMVCETLSRQIQGPNELLSGATLRFIPSLGDSEAIMPLVPVILQSVKHDHFYVRLSALTCLKALYKSKLIDISAESTNLAKEVLENDSNVLCQMMGFKLLASIDKSKAFTTLISLSPIIDQLDSELKYALVIFFSDFVADHEQIDGSEIKQLLNNERVLNFISNLMNDSSNEVALESVNFVLNTEYSKDLKCKAFNILINIFLKETQTMVKASILEAINKWQSVRLFNSILRERLPEIIEEVSLSDTTLQCEIFKMTHPLIDISNANQTLNKTLSFLVRENLETGFEGFADKKCINLDSDPIYKALQHIEKCCAAASAYVFDQFFEKFSKIMVLVQNIDYSRLLVHCFNFFLNDTELRNKVLDKMLGLIPIIDKE
ncbi:MAG: Coatomer subunit beta [Paramarteilia canceri]